MSEVAAKGATSRVIAHDGAWTGFWMGNPVRLPLWQLKHPERSNQATRYPHCLDRLTECRTHHLGIVRLIWPRIEHNCKSKPSYTMPIILEYIHTPGLARTFPISIPTLTSVSIPFCEFWTISSAKITPEEEGKTQIVVDPPYYSRSAYTHFAALQPSSPGTIPILPLLRLYHRASWTSRYFQPASLSIVSYA
jgi:hypothetical protein